MMPGIAVRPTLSTKQTNEMAKMQGQTGQTHLEMDRACGHQKYKTHLPSHSLNAPPKTMHLQLVSGHRSEKP